MEIVTGYRGVPHVTADDVANFNKALFGSGEYVCATGKQLGYEVESNNLIKIYDGDVLFQGRHARIEQNTVDECTIENGVQGQIRHDLIVVRYARDGEGIESTEIVVIKGEPGNTGVDPDLKVGDISNGDSVHEMPLYRVIVNGLNIESVTPLFNMFPIFRRIFSGKEMPKTALDGDIFLLREG